MGMEEILIHSVTVQGENKGFLVCKKKMATCAESLTRYTAAAFRQFAEAVVNLRFDEDPKYEAYKKLFEPLCGPAVGRPIVLEEFQKAGSKRARDENEEELEVSQTYFLCRGQICSEKYSSWILLEVLLIIQISIEKQGFRQDRALQSCISVERVLEKSLLFTKSKEDNMSKPYSAEARTILLTSLFKLTHSTSSPLTWWLWDGLQVKIWHVNWHAFIARHFCHSQLLQAYSLHLLWGVVLHVYCEDLAKLGWHRVLDFFLQAPKKKIRLGLPATQWITIYNAHRPMKQRYHYNVANSRIEQHVQKGNADGLFISSVACCHDLWGLIMDAGTGFTVQVIIPPACFLIAL